MPPRSIRGTPPVPPMMSLFFELLPSAQRPAVRIRNPIHLNDSNEPNPDVVLASRRENRYRDRHPGPNEVLLLMEAMFTGIIEELGTVREMRPGRLIINAKKVTWGTNLGDSIAVNGCDLTARLLR